MFFSGIKSLKPQQFDMKVKFWKMMKDLRDQIYFTFTSVPIVK